MEEIPEKIEDEILDQLNAASKKYDVEIAAVNATFNLIDYDKERLARNQRSMEELCRANQKLGCKLLTLCTGSRSHESMWEWHKDNEKREAWEELLENVRPVVEAARRYDMYLGIETEANNVVMTPEMASRFMKEVGYPKLKVIIDCANLFWAGKAHPENVDSTIQGAFQWFGNDIILAHGKDIGESDGIEFAATGHGIVNYDLFLSLLKEYNYSGPMVMHGIYDEALMEGCVRFMRDKIKASGIESM